MTAIGTAGAHEIAVPMLRQELRIEPGAPLVNGAPSWILFDPLRHAFYQLGRIEFTIFAAWAGQTLEQVKARLRWDGVDDAEADAAIERVLAFSLANNLTVAPMHDVVASFTRARELQRRAWWKWALDNYLFFRIPLVRPAAFLERTLPRVAFLWSPAVLWGFVLLALVGLLMVARQWDVFLASFLYFFSWQGLLIYGCGLWVVKVLHELGHAYTATRFGCQVPTMGVSFLVMMPVLYTDTTAAWRLTSRKQRLMIDAAGVTVELMVATIATLAWVALPEGPLRSVAFVTATTSWVMSLAVNLSPFMRFDGYYIFSDLLGVPSLQPRAFALGRWRLRELLFALGEPPSEEVPTRLRRIMIVYAWATWLYRFTLFLGIALMVYHFFFKILGIVLFAVELGVFIVRPIWRELSEWRRRQGVILATARGKVLAGLATAAVVLACLPLDRHVSAPAVLSPLGAAPIVAGDPAQVSRVLVANGQQVIAEQPLVELAAPDLSSDARESKVRIAQLQAQVDRTGVDAKDMAERIVLEGQLAAERSNLSGLERRQAKLVLRAPHAGVVADLDRTLHPGRWLGGGETLARVLTPDDYDVQAFIVEGDVVRVSDGARATFVPDDPLMPSREAKLVERSASAVQVMDQPILASRQGGPIAVDEDPARKTLKPREAMYRARLLAAKGPGPMQPVAGSISIAAQGRSLAGRFFEWLAQTVRAEASLSG